MEKNVLLITYSLSRTGAPIALFNMAVELKKIGYVPVVLSNEDGELRELILDNGIAVAIEPDLNNNTCRVLSWISKFDYVVINTVLYCEAIKHLQEKEKNIIWWVHEAECYYERISAGSIPQNVKVCGVGKIACNNFYKKFHIQPNNLFYGVRVDCLVQKKRYDNRMVFALVGKIGQRKGIDIFLDALELIPLDYRNNLCVLVIGSKEENEDELYYRLLGVADSHPEIQVVGEFDRERLNGALSGIDMLLLPSREDPMPVVFAEAAMNGIPSIVSRGCGVAEFVQDSVNGYLLEKNNPKELAKKMMYALDHKNNLNKMGEGAKTIFEQYFSMEKFNFNLRELLREVLWEK